MLLGCIGDDFTGSSDLANTLATHGMRAAQYVGVPSRPAAIGVEAGVVALKSRSIPAAEAVRLSLDALEWLQAQGCRQFFFKYCSTFDSTDAGNIGPVAEALADALRADRVVFCPSFPAAGRTVAHGHLFVGDKLLSESGMENHPLTPMTDPDLRRVLARQTRRPVGHAPFDVVAAGPEPLAARIAAESAAGRSFVIVDALSEADLLAIGAAAHGLKLVTGGSGVAMGLPANFRNRGELGAASGAWKGEPGPTAALCGSCSRMSLAQIARHKDRHPAFELDAGAVVEGRLDAATVADWTLAQEGGAPLVYSSANPEGVRAVQQRFGREAAAARLEAFFAELARLLVAGGVTRLIAAGGETSGAVVEGLGLTELEIGPEIDPGVPAMRAGPSLVVTLKSGNFGAEDFFEKAAASLSANA